MLTCAAAGSAGGAAAEGEEEISFLLLSAAAAAAAGGSRNYAVSCDICGKDMCNKEPKAAKAEVGELNEGRGGGHALKALQELKEKAGKEVRGAACTRSLRPHTLVSTHFT